MPGCDSPHGIYAGRVWHARRQPVHRFDYALFMLWLDLDQLDALQGFGPWLGLERWALASIRRADHLPGQSGSWREAAEAQARQLGCSLPIKRIRALCHARYLGCYFSPVNFYYLYGDDDAQPHSLLAEVSNTPWLQRHCYLVPISPEPVWGDKSFHVSPFMPLAMRYRWQIGIPGEQLQLRLAMHGGKREMRSSDAVHRLIPSAVRRPEGAVRSVHGNRPAFATGHAGSLRADAR